MSFQDRFKDNVIKTLKSLQAKIKTNYSNASKVSGNVKITVEENGLSEVVFNDHNLIVKLGRRYLAHIVSDDAESSKIRTFKLGTGGHELDDITDPIAPTADDTSLETIAYTAGFDTVEYLPSGEETQVKFTVVLETTEGNGTGTVAYTEAGLFLSPSGVLFAKETFPAVVKTASRRITFEWTILFQASA
jgi:hypothetical protein